MPKRSRAPFHPSTSKRQRLPPTPQECFFCLSNPNVAQHLVTSIGTEVYLTTAKGPLSTSSTFPTLPFPCHVLIIPLAHSPTLGSIADPETRKNTISEMERYRDALHRMIDSEGKGKMGAVTWEVNRSAGVHAHWQILPVPKELCRKGLVEAAFKVEAENERYPKFVDGEEELQGKDFFKVRVWSPGEEGAERRKGRNMDGLGKKQDGELTNEAEKIKDDVEVDAAKPSALRSPESERQLSSSSPPKKDSREKTLLLPLDSSFRFDLQFGRKVLGMLLGLEQRIRWQDCGQSKEDEVGDAEAFRKAFKEFDFSLEE